MDGLVNNLVTYVSITKLIKVPNLCFILLSSDHSSKYIFHTTSTGLEALGEEIIA